jgi:hypothetical protein
MNHRMAAPTKNSAPIIKLSRRLAGEGWNSKAPSAPGQSQQRTGDGKNDGQAPYCHGLHRLIRGLTTPESICLQMVFAQLFPLDHPKGPVGLLLLGRATVDHP